MLLPTPIGRSLPCAGILRASEQERAELALAQRRCLAFPMSGGKRGPLSALRNGRGGALVEEFGSVTRRFPWSVIAIEALSPMVFIHTRRIIIVPSHQHLLGFLAPLFESHRRLVWVIDRPVGDRSPGFFFAYGKSQHFDLGQELLIFARHLDTLHSIVVIQDTLIRDDAEASRSHSTIVRCN